MNQMRGIIMIVLAAVAFYRGWTLHSTGNQALFAYGLGVLALALGVWRLTRKPPRPLV